MHVHARVSGWLYLVKEAENAWSILHVKTKKPAGSRTPVEQQPHKHPLRPRLVSAVRYLLY